MTQDPRDWYQQHLANIVVTSMDEAAATNIRPAILHVDGHDICRLQVDPCRFPVDAKVMYQQPRGPKETRTESFVRVANGASAVNRHAGGRERPVEATGPTPAPSAAVGVEQCVSGGLYG
jgi:hypothetical protein